MVAVHGRWDCSLVPQRLHELEHSSLPQHVLQNHPVGPDLNIGLTGDQFGIVRIVEV